MKRNSKNPYPNLKELINYHPYHINTFAYFADVELNLLEAALIGEEKLEADELIAISYYSGVPFGVLTAPSLIVLNPLRPKHKKMVAEVGYVLGTIIEAAAVDFVCTYPSLYCSEVSSLCEDFSRGKPVTYCRYLGIKAKVENCLGNIKLEKMKARRRRYGDR